MPCAPVSTFVGKNSALMATGWAWAFRPLTWGRPAQSSAWASSVYGYLSWDSCIGRVVRCLCHQTRDVGGTAAVRGLRGLEEEGRCRGSSRRRSYAAGGPWAGWFAYCAPPGLIRPRALNSGTLPIQAAACNLWRVTLKAIVPTRILRWSNSTNRAWLRSCRASGVSLELHRLASLWGDTTLCARTPPRDDYPHERRGSSFSCPSHSVPLSNGCGGRALASRAVLWGPKGTELWPVFRASPSL